VPVSFLASLKQEKLPIILRSMSAQISTSQYMVLCRGISWDKNLSSEDIQNAEKRFYDWFDRLANQGKIINRGHRLEREGMVLSGGKAISDGPFAESKEAIAGYWIIQAAGLEEALEIAKGDPLLDYGHTVEVRRIQEGSATDRESSLA
jgi:hypothetical protein